MVSKIRLAATLLAAGIASLAAERSAAAFHVYVNGVLVDGIVNQSFSNCAVTIDGEGNIRIEAPGYRIQVVQPSPPAQSPPAASPAASPPPPPPAAAPQGALTKRYWMITEQSAQGATQYNIDVFINGAFYRRLRNDEEQVIEDITNRLRPGPNTLLLVAEKDFTGSRRSTSPSHSFRVTVGEGIESQGTVLIQLPLIRFGRTAAEVESPVRQEFTVNTR